MNGVTYETDPETMREWVKPGEWVEWFGMFLAPPLCGTNGAWIGKIVAIKPKAFKWGYDKVLIETPGDTDPIEIYAHQINRINMPTELQLETYTKNYFDWLHHSLATS